MDEGKETGRGKSEREAETFEQDGFFSANLYPDRIMARSAELTFRSKDILMRGKELGLLDDCSGFLPEVLNTLSNNAFDENNEMSQQMDELQSHILDFAEFYNSPESQEAIPFFGIEVIDDGDGDIHFVYAD